MLSLMLSSLMLSSLMLSLMLLMLSLMLSRMLSLMLLLHMNTSWSSLAALLCAWSFPIRSGRLFGKSQQTGPTPHSIWKWLHLKSKCVLGSSVLCALSMTRC
jgi:hypothetical protein